MLRPACTLESRPPSTSWGNGSRPGCANPRAIPGDTDYSQQLRKWSKKGGQRDRALSPPQLRRSPGRPLSTMKKRLGSQCTNWSERTIFAICPSLLVHYPKLSLWFASANIGSESKKYCKTMDLTFKLNMESKQKEAGVRLWSMIAVLIFLRHMFLTALHTAYLMERTLKGVSKRQCQYLQVLCKIWEL